MNCRAFLVLAAVLLACAPPLAAQRPPTDSETVDSYRGYLRDLKTEEEEKGTATLAAKTADEQKSVAKAVEAQPTSAAPPDGFSDRVAGTITDFLPYFQFAVDSVTPSDDGKAVVVSFNPVRVAKTWQLKLSATAAEPEPFARLLDEVPEDARAAVKEDIAGRLTDFDDVTWAATLGVQPGDAALTKSTRWGRDPELYRPIVRVLARGFADEIQKLATTELVKKTRFAESHYETILSAAFKRQPDTLTFGEIRAAIESGRLPGFDFEDFVAALVANEKVLVDLDTKFAAFRMDRLSPLIHNQPQLVFTASYRDRAELAGQDAYALTARLEWGTRNLNTVLRRFADLEPSAAMTEAPSSLFTAYRDVVGATGDPEPKSGWRGTASLTYQRLDRQSLDYAFTGGSVALEVPEVDEWCGKVQFSRFADWHEMTISGESVKPRLDLAFEVVEVNGDPMRQDRRIAKITYDLPIAKAVTIPVTLVYANKSEFLGEPDDQLSAHIGLSYKLPDWGK